MSVRLVKKIDVNIIEQGPACIVQPFNFEGGAIGFAVITLDGRLPEDKGMDIVNIRCDEVLYLLSGSLTVIAGDHHHTLEPGDAVEIPHETAFYLVGNQAQYVAVTTPPFDPEQHIHIARG